MHFRSLRGWVLISVGCALIASCAPPSSDTPTGSPLAAARAPTSARASADQAPQLATSATNGTDAQNAAIATALNGKTTKTVKVGLLLPLTGRNAELGRAMQDAATVSLFDKYARLSVAQQAIRVELLPKDTGDSPEFARAAMASALKDGAEIIIGPIFSDATETAAPLAQTQRVSVLSFSNNKKRASAGTYLLGFSPQEQTARVMDYALQHKKHVAVLVPQTPLGDEVLAAAQASAKAAGVVLGGEARYSAQGGGLDAALTKLMPVNGTSPTFDALLLADGGPTLETVLRALSARGINGSNVQFLGTGVWDDVPLLQRVNLNGAWFASSAPYATVQFENRFRTTYKYTPPRIASLSYDAVALAVTLATSGRSYSTENLTNKAGFVGPANGIFRLRPDGTTERGLAVIQVTGSTMQVISPAPTGFVAN